MGEVQYRRMCEGERGAFLGLMEAAFVDVDSAFFARYFDEDPKLGCDDSLLAVDGGRIISALQIFTRTIRLRGEDVALGGIGSVGTHPDHEGCGHASQLLRLAIDEMKDRGMALSLLFTGRVSFYERLDWVQIDHRLRVVRHHPNRHVRVGRSFRPDDLPSVQHLYEVYSGVRDCTAVRDEAYWRGQLVFAGNPDERFEVIERNGRIVAYARRIPFMGLDRVMEHGCETGAVEDLADLLLSMTPKDAPLYLPSCDAALCAALERRVGVCETVVFPDQMWRVLDRERLCRLAGDGPGVDDASLFNTLVGGPEHVYWPSDRF